MSCDNDLKVDVREEIQKDLTEQIMALIADKPCNGIEDCASIAWGVNACGTAEDYLVYAPSRTDEDRLEQLVADYNQLDREINELNQAVGVDCSLILVDPEIECIENQCLWVRDRYVIIN